jgi:cytochrome c oxidase subunit 3
MTENVLTHVDLDSTDGTVGDLRSGGNQDPVSTNPDINPSVFGLLIFLGTEVMLFLGLISAFIILRAGNPAWPPSGQPRLPVLVTGINTLLLLFSGYTAHRAVQAIRDQSRRGLIWWLRATGFLGIIFLGIQGTEWVLLVNYGLTFASSVYGGTFYTLIGCHGLHVLVAVIALLVTLKRATGNRYTSARHTGVELCRIYWFFVVGIWPVIYLLVYLS